MVDNDQNEPQQIDRPSQYPTATRIDNGVAYDVAGKVLGNVDENQLAPSAQAAQPSQAPSASQQDPLASLGGVLVTSAKSTPQPAQKFDPQDPLASLGGVPVAPPPTQSAQEAPLQPPPDFIHNVDYSISDFMMESLFVGSFGFLAGLGLWIFYRVVRFAIKG